MANSTLSKVILLVAAIVFPPLPIFLVEGVTRHLFFSLLLTFVGFHIAGFGYSIYYLWPYFVDQLSFNNSNFTSINSNVVIRNDDLEQGQVAISSPLLKPSNSPNIESTSEQQQQQQPHLTASSLQQELPPTYQQVEQEDQEGSADKAKIVAFYSDNKIQH
jgi:uncharacterized membrane protein YqaE (UPF0057 family)